MTALHAAVAGAIDLSEPLSVESAYDLSHRAALAESPLGPVGLEIEAHLFDLDAVPERVGWERLSPLLDSVRAACRRSTVTVEPGGQVELSGAPEPDITRAVAQLRHDGLGARLALAGRGLGLAYAGADPLRPPRRVNPRPRYRAMEQQFAATGRAAPGAVMMDSTAALQVNLQAGPQRGWPGRVARAHRLGPVLVAISASSPWLNGRDTGWKSARQRAWGQLDARACGPVPGCVGRDPAADDGLDPASAWAQLRTARAGRLHHRARRGSAGRRQAGLVPAVGERRGQAGRQGSDRGRSRYPSDDAVPARPAARLSRSALPRHERAAVVARHRGGRHHPDGRPRRGRPGGRGNGAHRAALDEGGTRRARRCGARRFGPPLHAHRRRPGSR